MAAVMDEDMNILHIHSCVFNASIELFLESLPYKSPCTGRVWSSSWSHCFKESELWAFSCRLTWERSTSGFWVVRPSLLVLEYDHLVLHRRSPGWPDIPKSCGDFPSRSTGCVKPSWLVSPSLEQLVLASPSVNIHWKSFLDLSLTWRSAFRTDQKEICWNGCKRTSKNSWNWTSEEDDSSHARNSL